MNEVIVYDKVLKIFEKIETKAGKSFFGTYLSNPDRYDIFDYLMDDTKGHKIYADSSIIEFKWGQHKINIQGYFTFNKEFLEYEIIMLNAQKQQSMSYNPYTCMDFKVIDTIQENKLGLISSIKEVIINIKRQRISNERE